MYCQSNVSSSCGEDLYLQTYPKMINISYTNLFGQIIILNYIMLNRAANKEYSVLRVCIENYKDALCSCKSSVIILLGFYTRDLSHKIGYNIELHNIIMLR